MERTRILLVVAAAVAIPQAARPQVSSTLQASSLSIARQGDAPRASAVTVSPSVAYAHRFGSVSARGGAWLVDDRWRIADGDLSVNLYSPAVYGVRGELLGRANRAFDIRTLGSDQLDLQTRVHLLLRDNGGAWIGAGVAKPWRVAVVSSVDVVNAGLWAASKSRSVSATATRYRFTKASVRHTNDGVTRCGSRVLDLSRREVLFAVDGCREQTQFTDLESSVKFEFLGIEYAGQFGYRMGRPADLSNDSRQWGNGTATVWVGPSVGVVVGGGRIPANHARGLPSQTYGTAGLVFAYSPSSRAAPVTKPGPLNVSAFELRNVAAGLQRFTVRMPSAERIEITGDFTEWEPVPLVRRQGTDLWELQLPIKPGVHHINIRIDGGAWTVPPKLTSQPDGFGGKVGVLIVDK